ncbi:hypothetical protein JL720_3747 [Aureococcus anophagefferens]|nr:hypothetical protein JL720_3747 [Aureococcus anophagefferens]
MRAPATGPCKCGSTTHFRTSHRDCPLKKPRKSRKANGAAAAAAVPLAASAAVVVPPGPVPPPFPEPAAVPPAPVPVATAPVPIAPRVAVVEPEPGAYVEDALPFRAEGPHVGARLRRSVRTPARSLWVEGFVVGYLGADESDFFDALGQPAPLYRSPYEKLREANIARNEAALQALGLANGTRADPPAGDDLVCLPKKNKRGRRAGRRGAQARRPSEADSLEDESLGLTDDGNEAPEPAAAPAFAYDDDGVNSAEV